MSQNPALPKFEVPINDKGGATSKYWYFFFQGLLANTLSPSGVVPGSYTSTNLTVNEDGIITAASNGSGGGAITVTDGTHTVTPASQITFAGAVVSGATPNATVTIAGGGTVTSVAAGTGLTATPSPITGAGNLAISNTTVTPGSYTSTNLTVNAQGQITAASNGGSTTPIPGTIADLVMWWSSSNILGASGQIISRFQELTPWIGGVINTGISGATSGISIGPTPLNGFNLAIWPPSPTSGNIELLNPLVFPVGVTFFAVLRPAAATTAQTIIGGTNSSIAFYLNNAAGNARIGLTSSSVANIGSATNVWTPGTAFQCNATYVKATGAFAFRQSQGANGSGTGTTGAGGVLAGSTGTVFIGADIGTTTNRLFGAALGEIIVYARVLSGAEIVNVENYLFAKWGV